MTCQKHNVIEELEEHLVRKNNPRRSKRAFGPLTPSSERPLVLPGGRRWYRPKDAYNDEFIAETLSAQAELITGSTLGWVLQREVPLLVPSAVRIPTLSRSRSLSLSLSDHPSALHYTMLKAMLCPGWHWLCHIAMATAVAQPARIVPTVAHV